MKRFITATAALTLISVPAQAQLLGTGPLTGGLGSALDIGGTVSRPAETLRTVTRGAVEGSATTDGSHSVDRNSGRVEARRNADIAGSAAIDQLVTTPIAPFGAPVGAPVGANANGNGSASGGGNAQAQLIGTDTVGSIAGAAAGHAHAAAAAAHSTSASLVGQVHGAAGSLPGAVPAAPGMAGGMVDGSASGEGSANGEGSASLISTPLAVAGSAAGNASGAASVAPGMPVVSPEGLPVGEVREIVANSRGEVEQVLVSNGDFEQMIPAANLGVSGSALVMGQGNADVGTGPEEDEQP